MKRRLVWIIALSAAAGIAQSQDLCAANPYTKKEAELGRIAFESRCAMCHQYSMAGRIPGNAKNESPDISVLSESDLDFIGYDNGGSVPPLLGDKFFRKYRSTKTVAEFSAYVSSAAIAFPAKDMKVPDTYFHI